MERQLAVILYADVAGYCRLTGLDEDETHQKLDAGLNLLTRAISDRGGRKVHEAGDAILAEFSSATAAVNAAIEFQHQMSTQNEGVAEEERLEFRVGVNLGEVIHDRDDIYGDGVNLAARIQELANPGGVCVSGTVYEQVAGKVEPTFDDLGHRSLKNIAQSVHVYRLRLSAADRPLTEGSFFGKPTQKKIITRGGCLCGKIRFEITAVPLETVYCHCRMCQKFAGAPLTTNPTSPIQRRKCRNWLIYRCRRQKVGTTERLVKRTGVGSLR